MRSILAASMAARNLHQLARQSFQVGKGGSSCRGGEGGSPLRRTSLQWLIFLYASTKATVGNHGRHASFARKHLRLGLRAGTREAYSHTIMKSRGRFLAGRRHGL